jgi:hypothetical protein
MGSDSRTAFRKPGLKNGARRRESYEDRGARISVLAGGGASRPDTLKQTDQQPISTNPLADGEGSAEPDQSLFGAIRVRVRRSIPIDDSLADTFAEKPTDQTRRADLKVNAIRVNLRPDEDGARKVMHRFCRQMFPTSRERCRHVPQSLLHRRIGSPLEITVSISTGLARRARRRATTRVSRSDAGTR